MNQDHEIVVAIIVGTILFILFAAFITAYIMIYWKRKIHHAKQVEKMKRAFNETLLKSQIEIQEQAFHTISQEIHDNVGQTLSLAKVQVNIIDQGETTDKQLLAEVKENIGKAMNDLRDLAKSLNSDHIQFRSLSDLIESELVRMQRIRIIMSAINETGTPQSIAHQKKLILFRIAQEALQNIIKHSGASAITVDLNYKDELVEIIIADNGRGFEPERINSEGLGLQNIRSRAKLIGGNATIQSSPANGTAVIITVPYA